VAEAKSAEAGSLFLCLFGGAGGGGGGSGETAVKKAALRSKLTT
jgi:hypothetical protein